MKITLPALAAASAAAVAALALSGRSQCSTGTAETSKPAVSLSGSIVVDHRGVAIMLDRVRAHDFDPGRS